MVIYTFQCYSLKSSHHHLLPQSPKVCFLHLCLFCCLDGNSHCYHLSKFHIYALIYYIGVFLSGLLHSSSFIHLIRTECILFNGWVIFHRCFWTVVLEKTLESPLDCKEIQPVYPKGDQSWVFIGRTDAKAETPVLWLPDAKSWLIGKDPDAGRDCGQEKGTTEDEMAGWHHWLDGCESEWTPGVGDGQGGLACCDSRGRRVGHDWVTELKLNPNIPLCVCTTTFLPIHLLMDI